jgi:hypothetical protein
MSGVESEQPARDALAAARSLARQAVRGLFPQAGHADQDGRRDRDGHDDDRDGRAYYEPKILQLTLRFLRARLFTDARSPTNITPMFLLI